MLVLEAGSEDHVVLLGGHSPMHWQGAAERLVSFVDQLHPDEQDSEEGTAVASHPVGMSNLRMGEKERKEILIRIVTVFLIVPSDPNNKDLLHHVLDSLPV